MSISDQGNTGCGEGGICRGRKGPEEVLWKLNWRCNGVWGRRSPAGFHDGPSNKVACVQ